MSDNNDSSIIFTSESYTVYTDSVVVGDTLVARPKAITSQNGVTPPCAGGPPIVTTLFNRAHETIPELLASDSLDVISTSIAVITSTALTHPDESADALRRLVDHDGTVVKTLDWPVTTGRQLWAVAAWQIWLVTGSREWLDECRDIVAATIRQELATCLDKEMKMVRGGDPGRTYPEWMTGSDIYATYSLSNNAATARALEILDLMDDELKNNHDDSNTRLAYEIKAAINESMWIPEFGYYGQYLYGEPYPVVSHAADNSAQAIAIACGTATPDMAESIISRTPLIDGMAPQIYPSPNGHAPVFDTTTEALWNLAASTTLNAEARRAGVGATIRLTAFTLQPQLATSVADLSTVIRAIGGISIDDKRMTFKPCTEAVLGRTIRLSGIRYRNAILDITVKGSGQNIAVFKVDDTIKTDPSVDASISPGQHEVVIEMDDTPGFRPTGTTTAGTPATMPPTPSVAWITPRHGQIIDDSDNTDFMIYLNGVFDQQIQEPVFDLFDASDFTTVTIVPIRDESVWGYAPRPHWFITSGSIRELPATALGAPLPQPKRIGRRKWRRPPPPRFVESDRRHNPTINTAVTYLSGGHALADIVYANPGRHTMVRTLRINDRLYGPLILPSTGSASRVIRSNTVSVTLNDSLNRISIAPSSYNREDTTLYVESMRIIKL